MSRIELLAKLKPCLSVPNTALIISFSAFLLGRAELSAQTEHPVPINSVGPPGQVKKTLSDVFKPGVYIEPPPPQPDPIITALKKLEDHILGQEIEIQGLRATMSQTQAQLAALQTIANQAQSQLINLQNGLDGLDARAQKIQNIDDQISSSTTKGLAAVNGMFIEIGKVQSNLRDAQRRLYMTCYWTVNAFQIAMGPDAAILANFPSLAPCVETFYTPGAFDFDTPFSAFGP